jgi:hypothetical protein
MKVKGAKKMNEIQKEFKEKTGLKPFFRAEIEDRGKIFYNDYVEFLELKVRKLREKVAGANNSEVKNETIYY